MGTFKQKDVLVAASIVLQDPSFKRYTPSYLNAFLNEACREVAMVKPNATAENIDLPMAVGSEQSLPDSHASILRAIRNTASNTLITTVSRTTLDATIPGWQSASVVPQAKDVEHLIYDKASPRDFLVYPPNDGTGKIRVSASKIPATLQDGSNATDVATYTTVVSDIPDIYQTALVDFVLYKAFSLDMNVPGAAQRAGYHLNRFNTSLGIKLQAEIAVNPRTAAKQGD